MSTPRICIVSHAAYRALTGSRSGHIGGVEHQTTLLAKWLVARGYAVDFITWREGDETEAMVDGVRLLTICRQDEGLPGLRFVSPRWTSLVRALRRSNADIYYHNTAECVTGQVGLWCRLFGRRFVFSAASHADCDAALPCLPRWRERVLYRLGLRAAAAVVVQTETQQRMMRESFAIAAEVIPMPCPEPDPERVLQPQAGPPSKRALWVGRICDLKRPELFLDAALQAPDLQFDLVGPVDGVEYGRDILERAGRIPNLTYHGAVLPAQMSELYQKAACLVCTSHIEGFPNTFLEAWSQGLPVVSTWDPDEVIARRGLGVACEGTASAVVDGVRSLLAAGDAWGSASMRARAYYTSTHRPELTFTAIERALAGEHGTRIAARTGAAPA
jgi:glycosyltransferase involved in cell wall biosynthesis